jgi:hypothetical protein
MAFYGVPINEIPWTTWWMLGSATLAFIGLLGWQIGDMIVGFKVIKKRNRDTPRYNWIQEKLLPYRLANRLFKRFVSARAEEYRIIRWSFNLMLVGLILHILFWVYTANFLVD